MRLDPDQVIEADFRVNPGTGIIEEAPRRASSRIRRWLAPLVAIVGILSKGKGLLAPMASALVSVAAYALAFGWQFAIGLVALLFVHEMGHVLVLRRFGVRATAPIFIPFLGAVIGMRQLPRDAVMEAKVGLGGPVLGSLGALAAWGMYLASGHGLWLVLTYLGVVLNLFNLLPIPPLDGGRAVAAISRWFWLLGLVGLGVLMFRMPSPVFILIGVFAAGELITIWRRTQADPAYYRVPLAQRAVVSAVYFGLAVALGAAMLHLTPLLSAVRSV
ncbi:site-2 protease family protein [Sphaerobacter sp.]|uniref:site-2 protease family protein n=1 Tax=Sphaerobacter sp. TaxID=2099654 RepID=UPI001D20AC58|nr:site-2 protease family protein [Sphaerobacter sp.]MBX5446068.1 site-2 protease family protein [Sphaerobacter sp.]